MELADIRIFLVRSARLRHHNSHRSVWCPETVLFEAARGALLGNRIPNDSERSSSGDSGQGGVFGQQFDGPAGRNLRGSSIPERILAKQFVGGLLCKIHASLVLNVEPFYFDCDLAVFDKD